MYPVSHLGPSVDAFVTWKAKISKTHSLATFERKVIIDYTSASIALTDSMPDF